LGNRFLSDDDSPSKNMRNHIVVITLGLPPEFFYQQLINRSMKSGKIVFPTLSKHFYSQIHVVLSTVVEIYPQFLQYLKNLRLQVAMNVGRSFGDVVFIQSHVNGV